MYTLFIVKKLTLLKILTLNLLLKLIKLWIKIRCLKFKLNDSRKKNKLTLNLNDGLFNNFLKILKKKLNYFS